MLRTRFFLHFAKKSEHPKMIATGPKDGLCDHYLVFTNREIHSGEADQRTHRKSAQTRSPHRVHHWKLNVPITRARRLP